MKIPPPQPIPKPVGTSASAQTVATGQSIPALSRIRLFSPDEWEDFVWEWADSWRNKYAKVEKCGGAGDMGRDVIATHANGTWDNYQCKHYDHPLRPTDVWVELGKLAYFTHAKAYSLPSKYFFVGPHDVGTKLSNLLRKPKNLQKGLKQNWGKYCKKKITSTKEVPLKGSLLSYVNRLDFSIFSHVPSVRLVDAHRKTRWHVSRFGGGLPNRPQPKKPPKQPAPREARYVRCLLEAYGDHLGTAVSSPSALASSHPQLRRHFDGARLEFYSAESLREFSRDQLPPGEFEKLQEEIESGILDEHGDDHDDGYRRVRAVVKAARDLSISYHALATELRVRDRGGICHQLANNGKLKWVP